MVGVGFSEPCDAFSRFVRPECRWVGYGFLIGGLIGGEGCVGCDGVEYFGFGMFMVEDAGGGG